MIPRFWFSRLLERRHGGVLLAMVLALGIGLATRGALLIKSAEEVSWGLSLGAAFLWGTIFDLGAALWWALPLTVLLALLPAGIFERRSTRVLAHLLLFGILFALLFGAVAEWFFWDEFGVRANFIAVDYLVYTTEVIGNIRESYPMPLIFGGLFVATAVIYALFVHTGWPGRWFSHAATPAGPRWRAAGCWILAIFTIGLGLQQRFIPEFTNNYNRELAKNGLWSFVAAFRANQLDFERFYPTMPEAAAFKRMHAILARDGAQPLSDDPHDFLRLVRAPHAGPELRLNVIQITVESLSAEFLARYGNQQNLMPHLDALAPQALVFDNFYATGTRTDRGMEALTLSVPPTAGRSLVKRPNNEHLFTLGSVFRGKGYATAFIYGGFGYFDNMNYFFGQNGYRVVDRTMVPKEDITFANVWGACDEDLLRWTLREADKDYAAGQPFFHFVMTTSNHRPYTFPEGKIDLPSKTSGRAGGVKYTDYAIDQFLRTASTKPWFKNTIFVIVADHCASSAGKTELPVQNYHIPMFIYAPGGQVSPGKVETLMSQVDYAPTLLGLLNWTYPSRFFGWNVLAQPGDRPGRALIGNYQKLGLYQGGQLGVLKPVRQSLTLRYNPISHEMIPQPPDQSLIDETIATYQTASWLFKHGHQRELTQEELARDETSKR
jgi:phosphoglycerol transferase MdoB-like AlkP superfamily enzyme